MGELLALLDDSKLAHDTLVLFTSEQGAQFPGCKWTNWDNGLHTSLVARWPDKIPAGKRTKAILKYSDVLPTLLDLAGQASPPETFDGSSFAKVLLGEKDHRTRSFGMHNNYPEGPSYPIRAVTNGEWRYIHNLAPDSLYLEKPLMGRNEHNPYWQTWVFSSFSNQHHEFLINRFMKRPAEELYHTSEDPFEMTNLAADPPHTKIKNHLAKVLDQQRQEQSAPGRPLDTKQAHQAAAKLTPLFPTKP